MSKIYKIICVIVIFHSIKIFAQSSPINQYNANGKKTGYWKIFLDEYAMPIDSANSYLFGYEFYDNGKPTFKIFISEKNHNRYKITYSGKLPNKGNPIPIHGDLKWFILTRGKEDLKIWDKFENGYPKTFKEYVFSDSTLLISIADFTKKYNNEPGTFYSESYYGFVVIKGKEKIKKYWYRKEKNKWKACEIK